MKLIILLLLLVVIGCASTSKEKKAQPTTPKTTGAKIREIKPLTKGGSAKIIEAEIRYELNKPTGELTKADLEKVTELYLNNNNQLTSVKGLEKLTQLTHLELWRNKLTDVKGLEKLTKLTSLILQGNRLTDVKGLEKLTQLTFLDLCFNPDLTKSQIAQLQKALPKCKIDSNPTK